MTIRSTDRITILRKRVLDRKNTALPWHGDPRISATSLKTTGKNAGWQIRRGRHTRDMLSQIPLEIDDLELLAGRLAQDRPEWQADRPAAEKFIMENYPEFYTPGMNGHCELNLSQLFTQGIDTLHTEIQRLRQQADERQKETYLSFEYALHGLSQFIENAAITTEKAHQNAEPHRRDELTEIINSCHHIAHHPPRSFRDALQLLWLTLFGCQIAEHIALIQPGHLDRTLWPYYLADCQAGRLTSAQALELLECFYLLLNDFVPDGLAIGVMVGGRDAGGTDVTNELSRLCLEALRRTNLVYPTVGVCWHEKTPPELTTLAVELIAAGYATPAFFGDAIIQHGLKKLGVPPEEACYYVNSTCVEITPAGSSGIWVAAPYFPVCQILLDEIDAQASVSLSAPDFDSFLNAYQSRLGKAINTAVAEQNRLRKIRQKSGGKPLQSVFTRDCLSRGKDIDSGGARYNWVECAFVGLANLADSLRVIQAEIYEEKHVSFNTLKKILAADFKNFPAEQQRFLYKHPKYGNADATVDTLFSQILEILKAECAKHHMLPDNSPFVPGAFCWIMHEQLGRQCAATPDGRRAGFPFADGCGAAQGREWNGPTAAVRSVTSWNAASLIGGAAFNMKFNRRLFQTSEAVGKLENLILTFLRLGGFETQINMIDTDTLKTAREHPENHRDLVVRIGGYTDYFTRLSPEMQDEIILRTEHQSA